MAWFAENWFSVLIFIAFIAMHMFGHGGHGGHVRNENRGQRKKDEAQGGVAKANLGGHKH